MCKKRKKDAYEVCFGPNQYDDLLTELTEIEQESHWQEAKFLRVHPLPDSAIFPMTGMDMEVLEDTAQNTNLMLEADGEIHCLRTTAISGLHDLSGLVGPCFQKLGKRAAETKEVVAEIFNLGIENYGRGKSNVLHRCGKVSCVASGQYEALPMLELLDIVDRIQDDLGSAQFLHGGVSHAVTTANFRYAAKADEITDLYKLTLGSGNNLVRSLTPLVEFRSSDTKQEAARLIPQFEAETNYGGKLTIPFGSSVKVVHKRAADRTEQMGSFEEEARMIYAKMQNDIRKVVPKMANTVIHHPGNAVIGLCKYAAIPQKWGGKIEEEVREMYEPDTCSFLDLYIALTQATALARTDGVSVTSLRMLELEDGISKIAKNSSKWTAFDLPGTVKW